jgi:TIR domain-containing protein
MLASATDVFVSYKAEDRARLKPLVDALEAEGFSVWWDTHIGGGAHWREDATPSSVCDGSREVTHRQRA